MQETVLPQLAAWVVTAAPAPRALLCEILEQHAKQHTHAHRFALARVFIERLATLREEAHGADSVEFARVLDDLAWSQICQRKLAGAPDAAIPLLRRALAIKLAPLFREKGSGRTSG